MVYRAESLRAQGLTNTDGVYATGMTLGAGSYTITVTRNGYTCGAVTPFTWQSGDPDKTIAMTCTILQHALSITKPVAAPVQLAAHLQASTAEGPAVSHSTTMNLSLLHQRLIQTPFLPAGVVHAREQGHVR